MIVEIEHPFNKEKRWKVAGNPIKFMGFDSLISTPPFLGEHKNLYADNVKSNVLKQLNFFQPHKNEYRCVVIFNRKDNKAFKFYSNSFTWLNSKETHLICGLNKREIDPIENLLKTVTFCFSALNMDEGEHKEDIAFLNLKLSNKNISEVSFINTEVEILLSVKA